MRRLAAGLALVTALLTALLIGADSTSTLAAAGSCSDLARVALPHTTITLAAAVAAGSFSTATPGNDDDFKTLPAFCRVTATLAPTTDSDIKVEVWLPAAGWNGKFQAV